jgi:surfeit locus 1 family protein
LLLPGALAIAGIAILTALGIWQLERRSWKEALIATLQTRLNAPQGALPVPGTWPHLTAEDMEFRRVRFTGQFLHAQEALVYATGSRLRDDANGPGYWVFTPARRPDGSLIVVDRGFVQEARKDPQSRSAGLTSAPVDIVGVMRWPESRGLFTPNDEPARNLWFVRDHRAIAAAKGWERVAPFYIEQESPPAPSGVPSVARLTVNLPNDHLQYALTWFALAIALAGVFVAFARARMRADGR